jgi:hypothetical protein
MQAATANFRIVNRLLNKYIVHMPSMHRQYSLVRRIFVAWRQYDRVAVEELGGNCSRKL